MTDTAPSTASPDTYSTYPDQKRWVMEEAQRLTKETGRKYSKSKVIQHLIDQARFEQKLKKAVTK